MKKTKMLKKNYSGDKDLIVVGLRASEELRRSRMVARGDDSSVVDYRIEHDRAAFKDLLSICDVVLDATKPIEELEKSIIRILQS